MWPKHFPTTQNTQAPVPWGSPEPYNTSALPKLRKNLLAENIPETCTRIKLMSSVHGLCPSDTKPPSLIPLKKTKSYLFYRRATIPKSVCPLFCFLRVEENPNSLSAGPARCIFHLTQNHREFVRGKEMPHRPHRMPGENLSATSGTSQRFWMLFMANNTSYRHCFSLSLGAGVGFLQPFADCGSDVPMPASVTEQNLLTPVPSSRAGSPRIPHQEFS